MNSPTPTSLKLLDSVPALLWQAGTDAKWNFFNKYWLHYRGRTLDQELGHGWVNGVHPGDRNTFVKTYLDHFDAAEPFAMEVRLRHRDGSYRWVVIHGQPVIAQDGTFTGYLGYGHDVTEQKRFLEDLRESQQRFQALANMSPAGVFRITSEGICEFVSDRWCEIAGLPREKAMGLGWLDALHPDDRAIAEEHLDCSLSDITNFDLEVRFLLDEGATTSWVLMQLRPEFDESGILGGFFGSITDLTPNETLCDEAIALGRFESLGILTGNMAHDFNDLLTPILLNLAIARSTLERESAPGDLLERIVEAETATIRARSLTCELGNFTGRGDPRVESSLLGGILAESARFATHGSRIDTEFDLSDDLWPVQIDRAQFGRAVQSLVHHAAQGMRHGGTVRISATNLDPSDSPALKGIPGRHIAIRIEELAGAIAEEEFFPEFDLLDVSGDETCTLGLGNPSSIIRKHGGHLIVETEIGSPCGYTIILPATEEPARSSVPLTINSEFGRGLRLLVMDDEALVRSSMHAILTALGFSVTVARNGDEAIDLYRAAAENSKPIDLALIDLNIPGGMGGKETVAGLKSIDPKANAVVFSGQSNDPAMIDFKAYGFNGALRKPFHPGELQSFLGRVVGC